MTTTKHHVVKRKKLIIAGKDWDGSAAAVIAINNDPATSETVVYEDTDARCLWIVCIDNPTPSEASPPALN